jgi:hypothetical protein
MRKFCAVDLCTTSSGGLHDRDTIGSISSGPTCRNMSKQLETEFRLTLLGHGNRHDVNHETAFSWHPWSIMPAETLGKSGSKCSEDLAIALVATLEKFPDRRLCPASISKRIRTDWQRTSYELGCCED